jgi:hypothetical protein
VIVSGITGRVGVVKCRYASPYSGVKIAANYRGELGLDEL